MAGWNAMKRNSCGGFTWDPSLDYINDDSWNEDYVPYIKVQYLLNARNCSQGYDCRDPDHMSVNRVREFGDYFG